MADGKLSRRSALGMGLAGVAGLAGSGLIAQSAAAAPNDQVTTGPTPTAALSPAVTVLPTDPQYVDCTRGLNTRFIGTPESVRIVNCTDQVVAVVQEAVQTGKRVSVISSGHCYENFIFNPDVQIVIDMTMMKSAYFDPHMNAVAVESGGTVLETYKTLYKEWGVTIPAGFCYSVAMGGHVAGGGWGPLCRTLGLVVDHLYAVEVVVVDATGTARAVVATRNASDPNSDLWWGNTGGGGLNFGVITRYWFRSPNATGTTPQTILPKPPHDVLLNAVSFAWNEVNQQQFSTLAQNYASWHYANRLPGNPNNVVTSYLLLNHVSNGQLGLITQVDATVPNAQQILDDYVAAITSGVTATPAALTNRMGEFGPMPDLVQARQLPWLEATRYQATTNPPLADPTYRAKYKSTYMLNTFPANQLAALYTHLNNPAINNPLAAVQFTPYGGQIGAVDPAATAIPHRHAIFKMLWTTQWIDPADDDTNINWMRTGYRNVYSDTGGVPVPNTVTDGCYVNYPDVDLSDPTQNTSTTPWSTLYYKDNYARLQQVKKKWDPRNVFHHTQSIALP